MPRNVSRLPIALFSAGWLFPLWLGVDIYLSFMRAEVWPRLMGHDPINSFPYLNVCSNCFAIAFAWLGLVILFWSFRVTGEAKSQ